MVARRLILVLYLLLRCAPADLKYRFCCSLDVAREKKRASTVQCTVLGLKFQCLMFVDYLSITYPRKIDVSRKRIFTFSMDAPAGALQDARFLFGPHASYDPAGLPFVDAAVRGLQISPARTIVTLGSFVIVVAGTAVQFATHPDRDDSKLFNLSTIVVIVAECQCRVVIETTGKRNLYGPPPPPAVVLVLVFLLAMLATMFYAWCHRGTGAPDAYEMLCRLFFGVSNVANLIRLVPSTSTLSAVARSVAQRRGTIRRARAQVSRAFDWLESLTLNILATGTGSTDPLTHCPRPSLRCLTFSMCLAIWAAPLLGIFCVLIALSIVLTVVGILNVVGPFAFVVGLGALSAIIKVGQMQVI